LVDQSKLPSLSSALFLLVAFIVLWLPVIASNYFLDEHGNFSPS